MRLHSTVIAALLAVHAPLAGADVLEMPTPYGEPSTPYGGVAPEQLLNRPRIELALPGRGTSMDQVERKYGRPQQVIGAVGDPPITRWIYQDFIVYFEYRYVIYSVEKQRPRVAPSPPPAPADSGLDDSGSVAPGLYD